VNNGMSKTEYTTVAKHDGLLEGFLSAQRGQMADRLVPPGRRGRVLDIGCGEHPRFLMSTTFAEKYGLDRLVDGQSDAARAHGITRMQCDIEIEERLPFDDGFFDVVTMLAVFEHIEPERLVRLVAEIRRILAPGGIYILTTPAVWTDGLLRVFAKLHLVNPVLLAEHKDAYSHAKIARILERGGFPRANMQFGYFELFMNVWATATK
jgi:SAM-dependent methyltransferase